MDPNRNDSSPKGPKRPGGGDDHKPGNNRWVALLIAVAIVLAISSIYNAVRGSQYTQTTWSDFRTAVDTNQLVEVEIQYDRIIYLTKEEAAKDPSVQKACFTGLPNGNIMELADELVAMGVKVNELIVEDNSTIMMILSYADER